MAVRTIAALVVAALGLSSPCYAQLKSTKLVFRAPFVLKLRVDNGHYYEETFGKVPYVAKNDVYLFAGDSFGIDVTVTKDRISRIAYQPDPPKADVDFRFTQERGANGLVMMLVIRNRLKRKLFIDALMTIPGRTGIYKTSILPIEPNLSDFESWRHPIVQMVLRNFRFSETEPTTGTGR